MPDRIDHAALDGADQDLRDAVRRLDGIVGPATYEDVRDCAEACIALHRREHARSLKLGARNTQHMTRAVELLLRARDFDRLTYSGRAHYVNDVDELVEQIRGEVVHAGE